MSWANNAPKLGTALLSANAPAFVFRAASEKKNTEAVEMLVASMADVNHRCNQGWTALHEAVSRNALDIIDILVKGGAKIEGKNCYGTTPLFVAAQSGQLDALRYIVKCGRLTIASSNANIH